MTNKGLITRVGEYSALECSAVHVLACCLSCCICIDLDVFLMEIFFVFGLILAVF